MTGIEEIQEHGVTEGAPGGPPMILSADSLVRSIEPGRRQQIPWFAIVAAALLHAFVLLLLVIDWSHPPRPPAEPRIVPVKIVFAPPPPPPPPPPPSPAQTAPTPPPPKPFGFREAGTDQRTTAPPPAQTQAAEPAAPPPPTPDEAKPEPQPPAPPLEKPKPTPRVEEGAKPTPHKQVARLEPQQRKAPKPLAPRLNALRRLDVEPGERFETGDPYLNRLHALIEQHRIYPRVIGPFGLPVEGTAVYDLALDRSGRIVDMKLEQSSGVAGIDRAVEDMIRNSLPFPPLPPDYPDGVGIVVSIRLFPPS